MGLMIGLFLRIKENKGHNTTTAMHERYAGSKHSITLAMLGAAFIFILFAAFLIDQPLETSEKAVDPIFFAPLNILYGISGSIWMAVATSIFIHGRVKVRDFLHGLVAGGIAVSSASFFLVNPVWAILIGAVAGILQTVGNVF